MFRNLEFIVYIFAKACNYLILNFMLSGHFTNRPNVLSCSFFDVPLGWSLSSGH